MLLSKQVVSVEQKSAKSVDPRILRTRTLLLQALDKLLKEKRFDEISVQDVTEAATVNRATFYDHYGDKFRLLECLVGDRFHSLLADRQVHFDGTCGSALQTTVLALCDYLASLVGPQCERTLEPHMESAILAVLRRIFTDGLQRHPREDAPPEMVAAAVSWAIYGAAKEWVQTPNRQPAEKIAGTVAKLVAPILHPLVSA